MGSWIRDSERQVTQSSSTQGEWSLQEHLKWIFLANIAIFKGRKSFKWEMKKKIKFFTCFLVWVGKKGHNLEILCIKNLQVICLLRVIYTISNSLAKVVSVIYGSAVVLLSSAAFGTFRLHGFYMS